ncbi:MAG: patatin [Cytophagales bacterium CG12_big_fil_rev_8_21_14_0_65_40_12]|nr:MAG: patatin [Cytophagales bacterium CG12_big_fil_rev_8_21_14_0_65_40_12]PIW04468.1 MAG: patatin [Cytophagales bacterium CG17_big_fil_post_rev_8_21_14_2_50_40_13]
MGKKIKILSIDGGGIRGIIPGTILNYLETALQKESENSNARLADYFDLIAGTSTGGILTCTYLTADDQGKSKYSAEFAVDLYMKNGAQIFERTFWRKIKTIFGLFGAKYSATAIQDLLYQYFGEAWISELRRPCIITSYDIRNRATVFFNKLDGINNPVKNYKVREVTRATSAAPTYFAPALIKSEIEAPLALVDGGTFANNPALCAYAEARTIDFSKVDSPGEEAFPTAKEILMISLGTGTELTPYTYPQAKRWGAVQWIQPVIDVMMSGNSETVDYQLRQIFNAAESSAFYHRIQPGLQDAKSAMDDVSPENLIALKEAGLKYISDNQKELNTIIQQILKE